MSFDHRDEGTGNEVWLAAEQVRAAPPLAWKNAERVVVIAAHPDDESLGAAGLVALAHSAGLDVVVIIATAGERSHPRSQTQTPHSLARLRRAEVVQAIDEVAPGARTLLLSLPDGRLREHRDVLESAIRPFVADRAARRTLLVAPWRGDGHPDHEAAGEAAATVARASGATLVEYPIWAWHWSTPDSSEWPWQSVRTVDLDDEAHAAKAAALARHQSQLSPLSAETGDEAIVSPRFARNFQRRFETFIVDAHAPRDDSLDRSYFETFYEGKRDPWGFETRWYEERKRALTLASLTRSRFSSALEVGCSIGVFTEELAGRCDRILATDIAEGPLETARIRLAGATSVTLERRFLPREWPEGAYDLIVISEVGYYLGVPELEELVRRSVESLTLPGGIIVACHWRHPVADYPLSGDAVHDVFRAAQGLRMLGEYLDDDFVLGVFARPDTPSVAATEGLV